MVWETKKTNEKRNKERSHNNKERISRDAVKIMLKKCHGGCHLALVLHCEICNMLSLHTFDSEYCFYKGNHEQYISTQKVSLRRLFT